MKTSVFAQDISLFKLKELKHFTFLVKKTNPKLITSLILEEKIKESKPLFY